MKPPGGTDQNTTPPKKYPNPLNATPMVKTHPCSFAVGGRKCPNRASHVVEFPSRSDELRPVRAHLCPDHFLKVAMDRDNQYPTGDLVTYEFEPMQRDRLTPQDR